MPTAQLQYLTDELSKLREQKLYQTLRILETEQLPLANFDGQEVIKTDSRFEGQELTDLINDARTSMRTVAWGDGEEWSKGKPFRYTAGGVLDSGFGVGGIRTFTFNPDSPDHDDWLSAMAV